VQKGTPIMKKTYTRTSIKAAIEEARKHTNATITFVFTEDSRYNVIIDDNTHPEMEGLSAREAYKSVVGFIEGCKAQTKSFNRKISDLVVGVEEDLSATEEVETEAKAQTEEFDADFLREKMALNPSVGPQLVRALMRNGEEDVHKFDLHIFRVGYKWLMDGHSTFNGVYKKRIENAIIERYTDELAIILMDRGII
jgi:hypothetical protein